MEYLLGSIITVLTIIVANKIFGNSLKPSKPVHIGYTQSYVFRLIKPFMILAENLRPLPPTQSSKHRDSSYVRVIIAENKAYWITNNTFYVADQEDGIIDKDTTRPVDIMGMDKIQLDKMVFIVETLTEGARDENWNSGNT